MTEIGLPPQTVAQMHGVFRHFPAIREVILYGSRAKGTYRPESDIDLALVGVADDLEAEAVAAELDALATPYRFDVKACSTINYGPLHDHSARVGISVYRHDASAPAPIDDMTTVSP